jgi:hypothetical protein
MDTAAKVIALTAADIICDDTALQEAQAEFKERMAGKKYESLLPGDLEPPVHLNEDIMSNYK